VPTYEYRCKACGSTFDVKRPMSESAEPAPCPQGHDDTVRLLSMIGLSNQLAEPSGGGGACCGGGCCS
jgi:putative FmdB family regulatory protein